MSFPNRGEGGSPTWEKFPHFPVFFWATSLRWVACLKRVLTEVDDSYTHMFVAESTCTAGQLLTLPRSRSQRLAGRTELQFLLACGGNNVSFQGLWWTASRERRQPCNWTSKQAWRRWNQDHNSIWSFQIPWPHRGFEEGTFHELYVYWTILWRNESQRAPNWRFEEEDCVAGIQDHSSAGYRKQIYAM